MIIAIWGRDGAGKSTLSDALGVFFSRRGVCIVIDTDLTQPTLPVRCSGEAKKRVKPLGYALIGAVATDIRPYLCQHPDHKGLFYAGLRDGDDFLSYELGLGAEGGARNFVDRCAEQADVVILDLSGQRGDPFLPAALDAGQIILPIVPDLQGLCWFLSVKPLLERMGALERVLTVASMARPEHDIAGVEKIGGLAFAAQLPWVRDVDSGKYARELKPLLHGLSGGDDTDA
jgi:MinD-like ATPase involved in chromosome partitioning or flagellar assembly